MVIEEHGQGKQLIRLCTWPIYSKITLCIIVTLGIMGSFAFSDQAWPLGTLLIAASLVLVIRTIQEYSSATIAAEQGLMASIERKAMQPHVVQEDEESLFSSPVVATD